MARPTLKANCPNCRTVDQAFSYQHFYLHTANWGGLVRETLLFSCNGCSFPLTVVIWRIGNHGSTISDKSIQIHPDYNDKAWAVIDIFPGPYMVGSAPEHTPENIASFFNQGCGALERGYWDIAGMGYGKALDTATKRLIRLKEGDDSSALKYKLQKRIDWLHEKGCLTDQLKDWAHIVRIERNDASHEEEPFTKEEAEQLHQFTEVFLLYVFTLPGRIEQYHNTPANAG